MKARMDNLATRAISFLHTPSPLSLEFFWRNFGAHLLGMHATASVRSACYGSFCFLCHMCFYEPLTCLSWGSCSSSIELSSIIDDVMDRVSPLGWLDCLQVWWAQSRFSMVKRDGWRHKYPGNFETFLNDFFAEYIVPIGARACRFCVQLTSRAMAKCAVVWRLTTSTCPWWLRLLVLCYATKPWLLLRRAPGLERSL